MSNKILEKESAWIAQFEWFENWQERYQFIIEQGRSLVGIPENERNEDMLVKGCQSLVWLDTKVENNILCLRADSDAMIVKGLIAIIVDIYQGASTSDIKAYDHGFAKRLGLDAHLSPARANGLFSIIARIKNSV